MGYLDAPFTPAFMGGASRDPRRYPSHEEVRWLLAGAVAVLATACTATAQLPSFLLYQTACQWPSRLQVSTEMLRSIVIENMNGQTWVSTCVVGCGACLRMLPTKPACARAALQVLSYLQLFADRHALHQHIQYNAQVVSATPLSTAQHAADSSSHDSSSTSGTGNNIGSNPAWRVSSVQLGADGQPCGQQQQQVFDAVVVCSGQYSDPNLPEVPGSGSWPGLQMHRCAVARSREIRVLGNLHTRQSSSRIPSAACGHVRGCLAAACAEARCLPASEADVCPMLCGGFLPCCSHNYRCPEAFAGQTVVVVGASNSGAAVLGACRAANGDCFHKPVYQTCTPHTTHHHLISCEGRSAGILLGCWADWPAVLQHAFVMCRTCFCAVPHMLVCWPHRPAVLVVTCRRRCVQAGGSSRRPSRPGCTLLAGARMGRRR